MPLSYCKLIILNRLRKKLAVKAAKGSAKVAESLVATEKGADKKELHFLDRMALEAAKQGAIGHGRPLSSLKDYCKYNAYLQHALDDSDEDPHGANAAHSQLQADAMEQAKTMKDFAKTSSSSSSSSK